MSKNNPSQIDAIRNLFVKRRTRYVNKRDKRAISRFLLENYDGDDIRELLIPLLDKFEKKDKICFLFLNFKLSEHNYVITQLAYDGNNHSKYEQALNKWHDDHPKELRSNAFRTKQFELNEKGWEQIRIWNEKNREESNQTAQEIMIRRRDWLTPSCLPSSEEYLRSLCIGYKHKSKNKPMKKRTSCRKLDKDNPLNQMCLFKTTAPWWKDEFDKKGKKNFEDLMEKNMRSFSKQVFDSVIFKDANNDPCRIDYFVPFIFGHNDYFGRIRFGFSEELSESELQDFLQRIYKLASTLYEIEKKRYNSLLEMYKAKRHAALNRERSELSEKMLEIGAKTAKPKALLGKYQKLLRNVLQEDDRLKGYLDHLCLLQITLPEPSILGLEEHDKNERYPFDVTPKAEGDYKTSNAYKLMHRIEKMIEGIKKHEEEPVYFALGSNIIFQDGLQNTRKEDVEEWKNLPSEDELSNKQAKLKDEKKRTTDQAKIAEYEDRIKLTELEKRTTEQILKDFNVRKREDLPKLEVLVMNKDKNPQTPYLIAYALDENEFYGKEGKPQSHAIEGKPQSHAINADNVSFRSNFRIVYDPSLNSVKKDEYLMSLGIWSCFSMMKPDTSMECPDTFRDVKGRRGTVLVGIPFPFTINGEKICNRVFAIFSKDDNFINTEGKIVNEQYFHNLYEVFDDVAHYLVHLKKLSSIAEKYGRDKQLRRLYRGTQSQFHRDFHITKDLYDSLIDAPSDLMKLAEICYCHNSGQIEGDRKELFDIYKNDVAHKKTFKRDCKEIGDNYNLTYQNLAQHFKKLHSRLDQAFKECQRLQESAITRDLFALALNNSRARKDDKSQIFTRKDRFWNSYKLGLKDALSYEFLSPSTVLIKGTNVNEWEIICWIENKKKEDQNKEEKDQSPAQIRPGNFFYSSIFNELIKNVQKRECSEVRVSVKGGFSATDKGDTRKGNAIIFENDAPNKIAIDRFPTDWTSLGDLENTEADGLLQIYISLTETGAGSLFVCHNNNCFRVAVLLEGLSRIR